MKMRNWFARLGAILIIAALSAAPALSQVWIWSQTAGTNATVDPSINWAEGMAPSAVNDSARAMMAQLAKWRDDGTGTVTLGGTSTAYTAATNQGLTALTAGYRLCFSPNVTNGATVTLNVDANGAKPLRAAPGVELLGNEMRAGTPYCATYFASNSGEYVLNNDFNPAAVALAVGTTSVTGGTPNNCLAHNTTTLTDTACITTAGASVLTASALPSFSAPINMQVNASISSNQLIVAVKGVNGSDPSATNPVLVGFRSQNLANGTNIFGSVQAALSFTLASTSSMGCATTVLCRLWGELICQTESGGNCTSVLVGLSVQSNTTTCFPLVENALQSTGSGTGGGTTVNTIQTSVGSLTGKAVRIAFYVMATWTSGTGWSLPGSPTEPVVQLFGPGVTKPCGEVNGKFFATSTTKTTVSNTANTKTQANPSVSISPTSAANLIFVRAVGVGSAGGNDLVMQLGRNSSSNLFGGHGLVNNNTQAIGAVLGTLVSEGLDAPGTIGSTTYAPFVWSTGNNSGDTFGGTEGNLTNSVSTIFVQEIMGAIDPANDNGAPLRMVG